MSAVQPADHPAYVAFIHAVTGELGRLHVTIADRPITYTDSDRDPTLPTSSCRLRAADGAELLLVREDLAGADPAELVHQWLRGHVQLRGARLARTRARADPRWRRAWHEANPYQ